jgi:hypothetical protein
MPLLWYQETRPEAGAVVVQADSRFLDSAVPFDFAQGPAALGMTRIL